MKEYEVREDLNDFRDIWFSLIIVKITVARTLAAFSSTSDNSQS